LKDSQAQVAPPASRSLILEQVTNSLAVRMAVLFLVNGGKGPQGLVAA
jgi:aspartate carbamoyltransferase catalytic subunit